jgi:hypothetical protein
VIDAVLGFCPGGLRCGNSGFTHGKSPQDEYCLHSAIF